MTLYVFGIGGTGARVMKALAMLLASGAEMNNTEAVIPILIDPDTSNGDLTRTIEILKHYQAIQRKGGNSDGFFGTTIRSLNELGDGGGAQDQFRFELEGVRGKTFGEFIQRAEMTRANQALTSMLYSDGNLSTDMEVGFKGNPHIGSVVLNKMRESELFKKFATAVGVNDRVFIISSIFGGTGAAGFPLLVKNIRNADNSIPGHDRLQKIPIGAVTLLPYFGVEGTGEKTVIDSNSFISKSKAALAYYAKNLTGETDPRVNAMYYLGDTIPNMQSGADGAQEQKNRAHFIELAGALAVLDFMRVEDAALQTIDGVAQSPRYMEYGLKNETAKISLKDLAAHSHQDVSFPLTEYYLFLKFFREHYIANEESRWAKEDNGKLKLKNLNAAFRDHLQKFNAYYEEWLAEMESSSVNFIPFTRNVGEQDILKVVKGFEEKSGWNPLAKRGLIKYLETLDGEITEARKMADGNTRLLHLFKKATAKLVEERIKL